MMLLKFYKYQGTGNDFIIIDNRDGAVVLNEDQISKLCNRKFGIGADGLMLLNLIDGYDFEMVYFNSDGKTSSMCGNGGRCIAAFARYLGMVADEAKFLAIDGPHEAVFLQSGDVSLKMKDVLSIESGDGFYFLDTGSPHYVKVENNVDDLELVEEARKVRYNERFKAEGTNVNFITKGDGYARVRTYERGVEDETLSCGTGVTAVALVADKLGWISDSSSCKVKAVGGMLNVKYKREGDGYTSIWLEGPAEMVFKGELEL